MTSFTSRTQTRKGQRGIPWTVPRSLRHARVTSWKRELSWFRCISEGGERERQLPERDGHHYGSAPLWLGRKSREIISQAGKCGWRGASSGDLCCWMGLTGRACCPSLSINSPPPPRTLTSSHYVTVSVRPVLECGHREWLAPPSQPSCRFSFLTLAVTIFGWLAWRRWSR